ncbi:MAG: hypothetical protein KC652_25360, partial [Cyanobacteria bacterium HKST-UBA01]|nr:hypothetical protein [Cyanobacteria bacterium HKST-UBA01]
IKTTKVDATIACIMIPRGLAAAVLASIAVSKGVEDSIILQSLAYSVILISIAATALFSFFCERKLLTQPYRFIFTGYKEDPEPSEVEEEPVSEEDLETGILHYVEDYHHHPTPVKKSGEEKKSSPKLKLVEKKDPVVLKEKKEEKKEEKPEEKEPEKKKKKTASTQSKSAEKPGNSNNSQKPEPKHDILPVITASTVSLSHSVGPGIDLTAEIVAHHHDHEDKSID